MTQICTGCGVAFDPYPVVNGKRLNLKGRKRCLDCLPLRRLRGPRKPVIWAQKMKTCLACGAEFPTRMKIDGVVHHLGSRRFCLDCSPLGAHNTSKVPPGTLAPDDLREHRRKKRNAKTYRYQKKKRRSVKARLIDELGGRCTDCGYDAHPNALEFHHLDASTKEFTVSKLIASIGYERVLREARKCVLVCANCHRRRHAAERASDAPMDARQALKVRAAAFMGGSCVGCGRAGPTALFEFHHRDAATKEFGIGEDGTVRSWEKIVAELAKCVMLCANCHREVHAGVRQLPSKLAEDALPYAA